MRKYLSMFFMLMLAATIGLSACAEQKKEPPPPPPPAPAAPAAPMAPADNAMKPAAPMAPAEAPKK
jgi:predicted lipid-binding transport protein (Tim44 family)